MWASTYLSEKLKEMRGSSEANGPGKVVETWSKWFAASNVLEREKEELKVNPFQTIEHMNVREWVKLVVGVCFLAPVRLVVVLGLVLVLTVLLKITVLGADLAKPLGSTRKAFQDVIIKMAAYGICFCFGIRVQVKGKCCSADESRMVVIGPHSTVMDSFVVTCAVPGPSGVGKIEASRSLLGPFMSYCQSIWVDRADTKGRQAVADKIRERIARGSEWNRHLMIFPEGTCTNRQSLISFRTGAFQEGVPVQPLVVRWSYTNFDPTWCNGAPSRTFILLRTLSQFYHSVTLEFLPVYVPNDAEQRDASLFANNVRASMADHLGVSASEHSYVDSFLAQIAAKSKMRPCRVLNFTVAEICKDAKALGLLSQEGSGSGGLSASRQVFEWIKSLLLCYSKVPGVAPLGRMNRAQFEQVAEVSSHAVGLAHPLTWEAVSSSSKDSFEIDFNQFVRAHLRGMSAKKM